MGDDDLDYEIHARGTDLAAVQAASARGSFATFGGQLIKLVLQIGSQLILARILFPGDFGLIAMVSPLLTIVAIVNDVGFGQVIVQRTRIYQQQVSNLFWISLGIGVLMAGVMMAISPLFARLYSEPKVLLLGIALALIIPVSSLGIVPNAILTRRLRFGTLARIEVGAATAALAISVGMSLLDFGYWSLALGQLTSALVTVGATFASCGWRPSLMNRSLSVKDEFAFGRNVTGTNLAGFAIKSSDTLLIGTFRGAAELGLYDRSYRLLTQPLNQLMLPVNRVAVSLLSNLESDVVRYRDAFLFMLRILLFATIPGLVILIGNSAYLIPLLLGHRWVAAAPIFMWFSVGALGSALFASTTWLFISQNRTGVMFKYTLLASLVNVVACVVGLQWGAVGVASCASLSFVLVQVPIVMGAALGTGPITRGDLLRAILPFMAAGLTTTLLLKVVSWGHSTWISVIVAMLVSYTVTGSALMTTNDGRNFMKRFQRSVTGMLARVR